MSIPPAPANLPRRTMLRLLAAGLPASVTARLRAQDTAPALPAIRILPDGWGKATEQDVSAVIRSATAVLWKWFPQRKIEPIAIMRGYEGPIVLYQRNTRGELVVKLDTADWFWCQYVYQFAHEFCHILCGFDDDPYKGNNWFEEALCEVASLHVLRVLADQWVKAPPYPNWKTFAPEFRRYAEEVRNSRVRIGSGKLPEYVQRHRKELESSPTDRDLNGAVAVMLLPVFESDPSGWKSIQWLNSMPSTAGESFDAYLRKWHRAIPEAAPRAFAARVLQIFEIRP